MTKVGSGSVVAASAKSTPTDTTFMVSEEPMAAGVASRFTSSVCPLVALFIMVVTPSGDTSSIAVYEFVKSPLSPVAFGRRCI